MKLSNLIIRLIDSGFAQRVDWSQIDNTGKPAVSYCRPLEGGDKLVVELRSDKRYNAGRYTPILDPKDPEEWDGGRLLIAGAGQSPATVDNRYFSQHGSTGEQVLAFLEAQGVRGRPGETAVPVDLTAAGEDEDYEKTPVGWAAVIRYRNWQGQEAERTIVPLGLTFGTSRWHPTPQWLLRAWDRGKQAYRDFALSGLLAWRPADEESGSAAPGGPPC